MFLLQRLLVPISFILFIVLFTSSCKTKQLAVKKEIPQYSSPVIDSIKAHRFEPNWLSLKAKCMLNKDGQKTSLQYNLRMKKDSLIWVSISLPMGIEGGRALIYRDSVVVLDRINNKVYTYGYIFFKNFLPFDMNFDLIQNLIYCNPVLIDNANLRSEKTENQFKLFSVTNDIQNTLWFNLIYFTLEKMLIEHPLLNYKAEIIYENYKQTGSGELFPENVLYIISGSKTIELQINFNKISVNVPQEMPFNIPPQYIKLKMN